MKIALVSPTPVPPTFGGMDRLLDGLCAALRQRHPTDLVTIPCDERTREGVLRGYYDFYHLDLSAYDLVISYKAPAYMVRHPRQVCYLSHRLRVFYDLYEPADAEHEQMRRLIHFMDDWALDKRRIPHLFTVGETVSRRLIKFGNHASTAMHHPTTLEPAPPRRGEYLLSVGRLHPWKRIDLIIRAMMASRADCPLKIAGEGPEEERLRELAAGDDRIKFLGKVSDRELAELYAGALATVFPPINEDMGLITFESWRSGKPIVTTEDSGEPALLAEEGRTGFIASATAEGLAEKFDWIAANRDAVEAMSEPCLERAAIVTWDRLVDRLLAAGEDTARIMETARAAGAAEATPAPASPAIHTNGAHPPAAEKIRLLVTDNQIIDPPLGGGRVRILELYRHLPDDFTTTYLGAFDYPGPAFRDQWLAPNFREILVPLTAPHFRAHNLIARLSGGEATVDVTMPLLGGLTPRYQRVLGKLLPEADVLIGAHPWMFPFFPDAIGAPLVYDSQNCEALVKKPMLRSLAGRVLAGKVKGTEKHAIARSRLILACSEADAASFTELYGVNPRRIHLAENGVDCEQIRPASAEEKIAARERLGFGEGPLAIFTGSNYVPNLEGAAIIIEQLAPAAANVTFAIAGGVGPMYREQHAGAGLPPNVRILGFMERADLLDLYRAADAALNPMRQGSGTNIKMLDYMAAGLPIVTTAKGARGIAGKDGEHWRIAEPDALGGVLKDILGDFDFSARLGREARKLAESSYDWKAISGRLAEKLRALASEARGARAAA